MEQDVIDQILAFWFAGIEEGTAINKDLEIVQIWFAKDPEIDEQIKMLFGSHIKKAAKGQYDSWIKDPEGRLAMVILLDQFSRNIHRDSAKAFDNDIKALEITLLSIKDNMDQKMTPIQRAFLYMPLMHSENLIVQAKSVEIYTELADFVKHEEPESLAYFESVLDFAKKHHEIIRVFERFPHRNKVLKRKSTSQEIAFLQQPASSF